VDIHSQPKIQKVIPKDGRYDPMKQKLFFKNAIEIFKSIPIPYVICSPSRVFYQPNPVKAPTSPPTPKNFVIPRRHPEQSQSVINLWFQLFFDILGDEVVKHPVLDTEEQGNPGSHSEDQPT
jgi:hypothetical protein